MGWLNLCVVEDGAYHPALVITTKNVSAHIFLGDEINPRLTITIVDYGTP